jgi:hypothetical protein
VNTLEAMVSDARREQADLQGLESTAPTSTAASSPTTNSPLAALDPQHLQNLQKVLSDLLRTVRDRVEGILATTAPVTAAAPTAAEPEMKVPVRASQPADANSTGSAPASERVKVTVRTEPPKIVASRPVQAEPAPSQAADPLQAVVKNVSDNVIREAKAISEEAEMEADLAKRRSRLSKPE